MNITKLLALILSFQASVQAVSLQDLYDQHRRNRDAKAAELVAIKIQKLKKWGLSPGLHIQEKFENTCNFVDRYLFHIAKGNDKEAQDIEKKLAKLKKWEISPPTRIVKNLAQADTFADQYFFHIDKGNDKEAQDIEQILKKLKELGIKPTTRIKEGLKRAYTFAERFVYHIVKSNTADAERIEKKLATLKKFGIDPRTVIIKNIEWARSFAELFAHHVDTDTVPEQSTLKHIETLKELKIDLSTNFNLNGLESEQLAYCLHKNIFHPSEILLEIQTRHEFFFEARIEEARKLGAEEESWQDTFFRVLFPEKQERKEELPEMNEEENGSPKRRHPDSKSE